jgi:hypothetical protein
MQISDKRWFKPLLYSIIGGIAGFAYYYFIGCSSNTCAITSNPYISTGYGIGSGFILGFDFKFGKKGIKESNAEND